MKNADIADIYDISNYTDYVNNIVDFPIWKKEMLDEYEISKIEKVNVEGKEYVLNSIESKKTTYTKKINYELIDYVTVQDREDVRQCVMATLIEILCRIKETGYLDKRKKYSIKNKNREQIFKLINTFLRNNSKDSIYHILKLDDNYKRNTKSIDSDNFKEEVGMKILNSGTIDNEIDILTKVVIKNAVKKFLKSRDELDRIIFANEFMDLGFLSFIVNLKKGKKNEENKDDSKRHRKIVNFTQKDIAEILDIDEGKVGYRKARLIQDFQKIYDTEIEPYL